ncbi:S8 family serine peptidase [Cellulomonas sp. KRMCY2]|uniref:S8 family peptidase n=1 Tax=Cellulomonas sp. KRMCY2 TaxID=1304865 RepID=UPI00045E9A08|nr:S8 family serine peptidase [Cellulomonas sp. KRMCY2]
MVAATGTETITAAPDVAVACQRWFQARPVPDLPVPVAQLPRTPTTGRGVRIALLDGEVDGTHPDLRGAHLQVKPGARPIGPASPAGQATAHASLLVGQGKAHVLGLVPEAELLVAPVLGADGRTSDELIVRAVRWALAERAQILVLPFGRRRLARGVATALRTAVDRGVHVLVSAGDLGPEVLTFPASVTGVLAVAGYDDSGLLPESSALADLAAPGRDVPAAGPDRAVRLRGSAPAAVLAAGAWAAQSAGLRRRG